jgi:hypothetical protein
VDIDSVAGELYGLAPADFTAARDARAAEAKQSGDRALADSIKQLKRPTQSAWLANTLVRQRKKQISELLDLGDEMREAQERLAGEALRELARRRHDLVGALAREARSIARKAGQAASDQALHELGSTLEAALGDPEASDAIRSGCLTTALSYSGFGSAEPGAASVPAPRPAKPAGKKAARRATGPRGQDAGATTARRHEAEMRSAESALREAKAEVADATRESVERARLAAQAVADEERLDHEIGELEAALSRARSERAGAANRARTGARALDAAEHRLHSAERRAAQATEAVKDLDPGA